MGDRSETNHLQAYLRDLCCGGQRVRLEVGPGPGDRAACVSTSVPALTHELLPYLFSELSDITLSIHEYS